MPKTQNGYSFSLDRMNFVGIVITAKQKNRTIN